MISKELLSEVLEVNWMEYCKIEVRSTEVIIEEDMLHPKHHGYTGMGYVRSINIYELAHKCKEWAWDMFYNVETEYHFDTKKHRCSFWREGDTSYNVNTGYKAKKKTTYAETEPEAIFKACQWILDNKD
jgi:hypothetical protein